MLKWACYFVNTIPHHLNLCLLQTGCYHLTNFLNQSIRIFNTILILVFLRPMVKNYLSFFTNTVASRHSHQNWPILTNKRAALYVPGTVGSNVCAGWLDNIWYYKIDIFGTSIGSGQTSVFARKTLPVAISINKTSKSCCYTFQLLRLRWRRFKPPSYSSSLASRLRLQKWSKCVFPSSTSFACITASKNGSVTLWVYYFDCIHNS